MARRDRRRSRGRGGARGVAGALTLLGLLAMPLVPTAGEEPAYSWRLGLKRGLETRGLSCLRIHPREDGKLWAYVHGLGPARSTDGGRTWTPMLKGIEEKFLPGPNSQVRISLDPRDEKILYVVIDGQIYRSEDAGESWHSITSGALASLSWDKLRSTHLSWEVRVDAKKGSRLLVGTRNDGLHNGGLFESTNSGRSWERIAGSVLPKSKLGNDTFLVRADPKTDKVVTVAGRTAVWYSDDRGRTFSRNDPGGEAIHDVRDLSDIQGRNLYLADARGVWRSRDAGRSWDKKPLREGDALDVHIDVHNRKRLFVAWHARGVEYSDDARHAKWVPVRAADGSEFEPAGYAGAEVREVLTHPRDRKLVYLASPVTGLHVSRDGGESFQPVLPPEDLDPGAALKVIPTTPARLAFVAGHPQPGGRHLGVSREGVVYRSEDRGETWARVGRLGQEPTLLQADAAAHTWWAGGRRLLRSRDDGATWEPILLEKQVESASSLEARVVACHRGPGQDGRPGLLRVLRDRDGALFSSADDGATWKAARAPAALGGVPGTWATGFAVDPANDQHLVIAARSQRTTWNTLDGKGGVLESWDGGTSWRDISGNLVPSKTDAAEERRAKAGWNHARFIALDPSSGLIVYAADGVGFFAKPWVDPQGKSPGEPPIWVKVNPAGIERPDIAVVLHTTTPNQTDTRLVVQLRAADGQAACYEVAGRTLAAAYAHATAQEPEGDAPGWTALPSPGRDQFLGSLAADPQLPGRLLATDAAGEHGLIVFEIPGSKPSVPKKDEPKKDEPKKDEPKKDEAATATPQPPEGMRAFSGGQDKLVRIWAFDTGKPSAGIPGHESPVTCMALAPDETHVLSGGSDARLHIWNAAGGKPLGSIALDAAPRAIAIDDDSAFAYVALGEAGSVAQVDLATRAVRIFSGHKAPVTCVAVSEDVNRAYSGGADQLILVWDTTKGRQVNSIAVGAQVTALTVSGDGTRIYAAAADGSLTAYDAAGKPAGRLDRLPEPSTCLALAPDGSILYATTRDGVAAIATADLSPLRTYVAPEAGSLTCMATSVDGIWILAGDAGGGLWTWHRDHTTALRPRQRGHEGPVRAVCLTREETALAEAPAPPKDDAGKVAPGGGKPMPPAEGGSDGGAEEGGPEGAPPKDDAKKAEPGKEGAGAPEPPAETPGK